MSDFRVRVRYHEIEVEVFVPCKEREYLEQGKFTHGALMDTVKTCTELVSELIIAGRKEVTNG